MEGRECKPAGTGALDPAGVPRWPSLPWHSISRVLERGSHYFNTAFQGTRVLTGYSLGGVQCSGPQSESYHTDRVISFQLHGSIAVSSIHDISACCSPQRRTKQFPTLARNSLACQFNHSGASHDGQILAPSCFFLPTKPVFYRRNCWQCLNLEISCNFHLYAALDAQQTYLVEVKRANWGKWAKLDKKGQKRRKRHVDAQSARSGHNIAGAWLGCLVVAYFQILSYRPGPIHIWE